VAKRRQVKLAFPTRHHNRRHSVAHHVHRRAALDRLWSQAEQTELGFTKGGEDTAQSSGQFHRNGALPFPQVIEKNGGDDETRTRDLCRDRAPTLGFTTTYKTAGTAKIPVSRARHHLLWVGLWVEGFNYHTVKISAMRIPLLGPE